MVFSRLHVDRRFSCGSLIKYYIGQRLDFQSRETVSLSRSRVTLEACVCTRRCLVFDISKGKGKDCSLVLGSLPVAFSIRANRLANRVVDFFALA